MIDVKRGWTLDANAKKRTEALTLEQFIIEQQVRANVASGEFSGLLRDIGLAAKVINRVETQP